MNVLRTVILVAAAWLAWGSGMAGTVAPLPLEQIRLPPGFAIELVARVPNARGLALSGGNVLYVGSMAAGKVHAVELDGQWRARQVHVVASGLERPVGVAWREGTLYVSAVDRILCLDDIDRRLARPRRRYWSATASPRKATTAGSSSPSAPTVDSTCPWGRRAIPAPRTRTATPPSSA